MGQAFSSGSWVRYSQRSHRLAYASTLSRCSGPADASSTGVGSSRVTLSRRPRAYIKLPGANSVDRDRGRLYERFVVADRVQQSARSGEAVAR